MGRARIISGGPNGRYVVDLDYGEAQRVALVAAVQQQIVRIDLQLASLLVATAEAQVKEAELLALLQAAADAVIAATAANLPPGNPQANTALFRFAAQQLAQFRIKALEPLRINKAIWDRLRATAVQRAASWNNFVAKETREVWCTDLTVNAPAGRFAATIDIPGESALVLLAAGCRAWQASDGDMKARELMSPEQVFVNAAILPGWQKFKPTYRWGTATGINYDNHTMTVELGGAISSARSLSVNQSSTLSNIPVIYQSCHALAFEVGDNVVVEFQGQDWASPRVIGFLDNPKQCLNATITHEIVVTNQTGQRSDFTTIVTPISSILVTRRSQANIPAFTAPEPIQPVQFIGWHVNGLRTGQTLTHPAFTATQNMIIQARYLRNADYRGFAQKVFVSAEFDPRQIFPLPEPARIFVRSTFKMVVTFTSRVFDVSPVIVVNLPGFYFAGFEEVPEFQSPEQFARNMTPAFNLLQEVPTFQIFLDQVDGPRTFTYSGISGSNPQRIYRITNVAPNQ